MFNKIAIFGLGLLGGSICKGVKVFHSGARENTAHISAFARNPEKIIKAKEEGAVDEIRRIGDFDLKSFDLLIVSTPILSSIELIKKISPMVI